jgi:hypothetical protein
MPDTPTAECWVIHDGAAGNRRQALALAHSLGLASREWSVHASAPARWLAPRLGPFSSQAFGGAFAAALRRSPPRLAIGCGRIAALATRLCRRAGSASVQVLDPRISTSHWDLVIAPEHDQLQGNNVISLCGSLNPVDEGWLESARSDFPAIAALASPRIAVLVGGPTQAVPLQASDIQRLCDQLGRWLDQAGGSVIACGSRRTPGPWGAILRERFPAPSHLAWMDASDGRNPFAAVLGWANRIVVTADSVNMISEACSSAAPVRVAGLEKAGGRIRLFLDSLLARGRIQPIDQHAWAAGGMPLQETSRVAALVRERLNLG